MRKLLLIVLLIALPAALSAQTQKIKFIFEEFSEKPGITSISLNDPGMLAAMFKVEGMQDALKELKTIKVIVLSDEEKAGKLGDKFIKKVKELKEEKPYKEYLAIDADGTRVRIYFTGEKNAVVASYITVISEKQTVLAWLDGNIDLDKLQKLGAGFNKSGGEEDTTKKGE